MAAEEMPPPDAMCICGDAASAHRLRKRGCKADDCGCDRFDPTGTFTPEAAPQPSEQSTSARLREVEREALELAKELVDTNEAYEALAAQLADARSEMTDLRKNEEIRAKVIQERNAERRQLRERVAELEALLAHAEQYARDLQDNGDVAPVEIHGWDAWQCFTCGSRYRRSFDHTCGPLRPVRVSIHER